MAPAPSGVDTAQAWTGYVAAHRGDVSLAVEDGRGATVVLRPGEQQPLASAAKVQQRWADETATGSVNQLTALHRAIATGAFGPGADAARRHLEWQKASLPGVVGVGFKGGSLPGVLTEAFTVRREDGSTATGILLVRRMPATDWIEALTSFAHQQMLVAAMTDPAVMAQLKCSV